MGGVQFMTALTLVLIAIVIVFIFYLIQLKTKKEVAGKFNPIKELGLFALVLGVLGQFIGLYGAYEVIEQAGQISQGVLAAGLKVSSITSIYGMLIFLIAYLFQFGLKASKTYMVR